jgi:hypothetical protein
MGDLIPLFLLADLALLVAALFDCITTDEHAVRSLPKIMWIMLIVVIPTVGAIMWFVAGRPTTAPQARPTPDTWAPGGGFPENDRPRQLAPDDDPEFLRKLGGASTDQARREDEERLRKWEADLKRREDLLRDRDEPPTD